MAVISRHSERQVALPRRWNRSARAEKVEQCFVPLGACLGVLPFGYLLLVGPLAGPVQGRAGVVVLALCPSPYASDQVRRNLGRSVMPPASPKPASYLRRGMPV